MRPEIASKLTNPELLFLIEEARNAEMCRDIDALRKILQTVWKVNDRSPSFTEFEPAIRGELLRLCGFFLTFYGRSRNLRDYQLQAKDVLTNAIEIFETEKLFEKAAESRIILAFCYWNSGEVSECEALLILVENDFSEDKIHPVYLQIQINRLLILAWNKKYEEAINTIDQISGSMEFCRDLRLKAMFHSEAGITFRRAKRFEEASYHYQEALRITTQIGNKRFVALNLNNLALLYRDIKDFKASHSFVDRSLEIYSDLGDRGWIPHVLDTKALIYIDENKFPAALKTIEEALSYFYKGEDYDGLTAALWTKVRCLIRLGRAEDALITFIELEKIALKEIGEIAVRKFTKNLTEEIYFLRHLPFSEEVAEFKKARVGAALIAANGVVGKAAQILRLKNHQALSEILNKQFPELLGELGFKRRARRTPGKSETRSSKIPKEREISRLNLKNKNFAFDFNFSSEQFETFYFGRSLMKSFGIESDAIVAVVPAELKTGMIVLISGEDGFAVGKTEYDEFAGVYFISDDQGNTIPVGENNFVGAPVGFCPFSEAGEKFIGFSRLG